MLKDFFMFWENFYFLYLTIVIPIILCVQLKFRKAITTANWIGIIGLFVCIDFVKFKYILSNSSGTEVAYTGVPNELILGTLLSLLVLVLLLFKGVSYREAIGNLSLIYLLVYAVRNIVPLLMMALLSNVDMLQYLILVSIFSVMLYYSINRGIIRFLKRVQVEGIFKKIIWLPAIMVLVLNVASVQQSTKEIPAKDQQIVEVAMDEQNQTSENFSEGTLLDGSFYLFLFILIMVSAIFIIINNNEKNQKLQFQIERSAELENYIQSIELIRDEILSYQHDYDNIFIGLSGVIYDDEFSLAALKSYYENSSEQILRNKGIRIIKLLNLKNINIPELKGILAPKILQANQKDIKIHFEAKEPIETIEMSNTDLTRCVGILLDNAIEAAEKSEEKEINLAFVKKHNSVIFVIQNTYNDKEYGIDRKVSKDNYRHGFGLKNIQQIIGRYKNVQLKTKIQTDYFIQEIYFYEKV
ncbi:GHKL domain-containing protein [Enterococcus sp. LJL128]|uniref:GHKL domain-containing protein n=1 Tax=Enterococcus sp. LJL51 TaxID=3416656 RepID=UPI003CF8F6EC